MGTLIIISGFLIGIAAFDFDWTYLFVQKMFAYIPNGLAALLVLFVGNVCSLGSWAEACSLAPLM
jgi:hypothetical protein